MSLSYNQFEVLTFIERKQDNRLTQRNISKCCKMSLGKVNKVLAELQEMEILEALEDCKYTITAKGYDILKPYQVNKAIFMAAGFGSRMIPVTLNTPKPLIKVHGKSIIETLLDAVLDAGIRDITIVRGYLGEQFDVLLKKYPMIKFVDNPLYNETSNISSAYAVRDMLSNAYVFESDLVLYKKELIRKYEYTSHYLGMYVERTDDWCFEMKKDYISKVKVGGENVYQMYGISYWTKEDGEKLKQDIETVYNSPGGKEKYWDEVPLRECKNRYKVMLRLVENGDIVELDTYNELKKIDSIYNI